LGKATNILLDSLSDPELVAQAIETLEKRLELLRSWQQALPSMPSSGLTDDRSREELLPESDDELPEDNPAQEMSRGIERARAYARYLAEHGPVTLNTLGEAFGTGYQRSYKLVSTGNWNRWFSLEGGKVHLTNEGRLEALPPKE
jgi:hypothetical protein